MNVIFTCGGTGGHINPAIAVANTWKERYPDSKILFIGATGHMEEKLVPAAGYELDKLTYKKGTDAAVDINTTTKSFAMPAGDVTIDATFKKINYTVTITSGTGGTAGVDKTTANINDVVTISVTASEGYELDKIEATGGVTVGSDKKFTMGNANVTITVTFKSTSST